MPNDDGGTDDGRSHLGFEVLTNHKTAMEYLADERSEGYGNRVYVSELGREAVEEYLATHWDELPEEAKDLLDDDMKANAGAGERRVEA